MSLRHSILGILSITPMSGYELKKVIDGSVGHFWAADQSQVYRTLSALVDDGMASRRTVVQEDRPNLHIHSVTEVGLAELDRWLASPLRPQPSRDPFLARLFFADRLPMDQVRELLDARRKETAEALTALETIRATTLASELPKEVNEVAKVLRLATLDYGIAQGRAELDWIEATERNLEELPS